jgi:hypothetical protein
MKLPASIIALLISLVANNVCAQVVQHPRAVVVNSENIEANKRYEVVVLDDPAIFSIRWKDRTCGDALKVKRHKDSADSGAFLPMRNNVTMYVSATSISYISTKACTASVSVEYIAAIK